eukprot:COSAG02_NODE_18039_length_964_cov_3.246243_2_plen_83_part_00
MSGRALVKLRTTLMVAACKRVLIGATHYLPPPFCCREPRGRAEQQQEEGFVRLGLSEALDAKISGVGAKGNSYELIPVIVLK